jgi:hypothetical protein
LLDVKLLENKLGLILETVDRLRRGIYRGFGAALRVDLLVSGCI